MAHFGRGALVSGVTAASVFGALGVVSFAALGDTDTPAKVELQNDGDIHDNGGDTGANWVEPANATVAALYQVRASALAGTGTGFVTGTFGSWLDLSTTRAWGSSTSGTNASFTLEIREKTTGVVRFTRTGNSIVVP